MLLYFGNILIAMKLKIEDEWEITIHGSTFRPKHIGCELNAIMFNSDGQALSSIKEHDDESYCVCGCALVSPKLKEFEIVVESIKE